MLSLRLQTKSTLEVLSHVESEGKLDSNKKTDETKLNFKNSL
jgi:hypothetical protein